MASEGVHKPATDAAAAFATGFSCDIKGGLQFEASETGNLPQDESPRFSGGCRAPSNR